MGEPQRSDAVESDRRSSPRFPADLLGKASVRLLGGSEVTLINFSERGLLFQSETRLLVGARGTVRIVVGGETTIAAGTVVRSLVQGMASGKLAFHTALALDQPLALAAAVERARAGQGRGQAPSRRRRSAGRSRPVEAGRRAEAGPGDRRRSNRRLRSPRRRSRRQDDREEVAQDRGRAATPPAPATDAQAAGRAEPPAPVAAARAAAPRRGRDACAAAVAPTRHRQRLRRQRLRQRQLRLVGCGGRDRRRRAERPLRLDDARSARRALQGILAGHRRDIVLTTVIHSKAETIADIARQHDVLLFDFAIGPEALERTLSALRTSPLGASIAILVPQQTALPPAVSSLANACVIETTSGDMLAAALRDAAWTPWQPVDGQATPTRRATTSSGRPSTRCRCRCSWSTPAGTIVHAERARARSSPTAPRSSAKPLASFFVAEHAPAIARLIADGLAGGYDGHAGLHRAGRRHDGAGRAPGAVGPARRRRPAGAGGALRAARRGGRPSRRPPDRPRPRGRSRGADRGARRAGADRRRLARRADAPARGARGDARPGQRARAASVTNCAASSRSRSATSSARASWSGPARRRSLELERVVAEHRADGSRRGSGAGPAGREHRGAVDAAQRARRAAACAPTSQGAEAERTVVRYAAIETSARQAIEELKTARADAQRLTRERDKALAAVEAERARADAALAAVRDEAKKSREDRRRRRRGARDRQAAAADRRAARRGQAGAGRPPGARGAPRPERREPRADDPGLRGTPRSPGRRRRGQAYVEAEEDAPGLRRATRYFALNPVRVIAPQPPLPRMKS